MDLFLTSFYFCYFTFPWYFIFHESVNMKSINTGNPLNLIQSSQQYAFKQTCYSCFFLFVFCFLLLRTSQKVYWHFLMKMKSFSTYKQRICSLHDTEVVTSLHQWNLSVFILLNQIKTHTFKQIIASVPQPHMEQRFRSPWKYLAYRREIGKPYPKPA